MLQVVAALLAPLLALSQPPEGVRPAEPEQARVQDRLRLVHELLQSRHVVGLSAAQQNSRQRNLDTLERYWRRGVFPRNTQHPGVRAPYWIDDVGTYCAAAFLISESGDDLLARKIGASKNNMYVDEMDDPELSLWVSQSGLDLEEVKLIQPTYAQSGTVHHCVAENLPDECRRILRAMTSEEKRYHTEQLKYARDAEMVELLLKLRVPPNAERLRGDVAWGGTPLWHAMNRQLDAQAFDGKVDANYARRIELLKAAGATLLRDEELLIAIRNKRVDQIRALLAQHPQLKSNIQADRQTSSSAPDDREYARVLPFAARYGDENVIDLLFEHGAVANAVYGIGRSALHHAALENNAATVRALLKHGADPRMCDDTDSAARRLAAIDEVRREIKGHLTCAADDCDDRCPRPKPEERLAPSAVAVAQESREADHHSCACTATSASVPAEAAALLLSFAALRRSRRRRGSDADAPLC